ncbi:Cof-type HAD-IIB family hydrolase [Saliterribacillus persicus]|uniref:Cof subfamily protein (Haloacid dehalogenase superfamily)/HAD superfamily hydrolase (TIGR01484 family) n=1 Tax=Saliterribacillus persicus TaxID=930114 RepID=A0A368XUT8_9BACI|nr:Cof-type HAD-IIB family hydrolase [Saliterribacillus persicus]RCW71830.1 hypothetical protein DFR57_10512 [Saliterribacillus persicus]
MEQSVVFLDIDGTILDHEKKIPDSTKEGIKALQDNGIIVAIATGRAPFMFRDILKELNINSFISFNGQYVVYEGEVIHNQALTASQLENLTKYGAEYNHSLVYQAEHAMKASHPSNFHITSGMQSLQMNYPEVDANFFKKHSIYQVLLFNEEKEQEVYEEKFADLRFIRWHQFSCDVMPENGSKAYGVRKFIEKTEIPWENTYAFGDGLNDLEMIQLVNTGVVMGNGLEILKEAGDVVTDSVSNNGVYNGLLKLGLIK